MSRSERRRKTRAEREVRKFVERGGTGTTAGTPDSWLALARRFMKREGGAVHITHPAMELLERYGYDVNTAIYAHFKRAGAQTEARSYLRVGDSPTEERIAVQYVPEQQAIAVWRWGEAEHDPDLCLIEELDADA